MKRSKRINNVRKIKAQSEKEAMGRLSQALSVQQQVVARYQELIQFRQEYRRGMLELGRQGLAASRIQGFHRFLENLDRAVEQQARLVADQEARVEVLKLHWQSLRKSLTGVENWMDQVLQQERKVEEQKEQKELDELANQKHYQRK